MEDPKRAKNDMKREYSRSIDRFLCFYGKNPLTKHISKIGSAYVIGRGVLLKIFWPSCLHSIDQKSFSMIHTWRIMRLL